MSFSHILIALGQQPGGALDYAIRLARESDAQLTALHVIDLTPDWALATGYCFGFHEQLVSHAQDVLELSARRIRFAGVRGSATHLELPAWGATKARVIAQAAHRLGADAIVVGGMVRHGWWRGRSMFSQITGITSIPVLPAHVRRDPV